MKLIKGSNLTDDQKSQVFNAFGYRWTEQNEQRARKWFGTLSVPTMPPQTDGEWLREHAFYFEKDGTLSSARKHCEPAYMAD